MHTHCNHTPRQPYTTSNWIPGSPLVTSSSVPDPPSTMSSAQPDQSEITIQIEEIQQPTVQNPFYSTLLNCASTQPN